MYKGSRERPAPRGISLLLLLRQVKVVPFTVGDALQLEVLQSCKALTGSSGLKNEVRWVNIIEILDDLRHIEAGEFLITTAYDLNMENEARQRELIDYFTKKGLAALAIQTGYYIEEIPPFFIRLAAEHGIPVIEIPFEISFNKLTRSLLGELMRRNAFWENGASDEESSRLKRAIRLAREQLHRLLKGENPENFKDDLARMHISPDAAFYLLAVKVLPPDPAEGAGVEPEEPLLLEPALIHLLLQHKLPFLAGPFDGSHALLLQAVKQTPEQLLGMARRVVNELRLLFPQFKFASGASSKHEHLSATSCAMREAHKAMHIAELGLIEDDELLTYDNLGIFKILPEVQSSEPLKSIYQETIAPLLAYDRRTGGALVQTLRAYLNYLNISQASRKLFIHRHTMKYRLNQIEELTKMPLDAPGNVFKLHLGLFIHDYLHARGTL